MRRPSQIRPPQAPLDAVVNGVLGSLFGDGLRVSATTGRRTFTGGGMSPQTFRRPTGPNHENDLEMAPARINTRRAQNRARGLP